MGELQNFNSVCFSIIELGKILESLDTSDLFFIFDFTFNNVWISLRLLFQKGASFQSFLIRILEGLMCNFPLRIRKGGTRQSICCSHPILFSNSLRALFPDSRTPLELAPVLLPLRRSQLLKLMSSTPTSSSKG